MVARKSDGKQAERTPRARKAKGKRPADPPDPSPASAGPTPPPSANGDQADVAGDGALTGVLTFTEADIRPPSWFLPPWIPRGVSTLLVGAPSAGKSTFLAFLVKQAQHTIMLPGEEDIQGAVLPRLRAVGVDLKNVSFVPADEGWRFPLARDKLIRLIKDTGADLVPVDPLDSYFDESADENHNQVVRRLLDSFKKVAEETGAAIVLVRHPGKDPTNLVAGSRAFRSHPRAILQMGVLPGDRDRGILQALKPPLGRWPVPRSYQLVGAAGDPKMFAFGDPVSEARAREVTEVADRMELTKVDEAEQLLRRLLDGGEEMLSKDVYRIAEGERLKDRSVRVAAERLGVLKRREGTRSETVSKWRLPPR